jgi:hypothetical protein
MLSDSNNNEDISDSNNNEDINDSNDNEDINDSNNNEDINFSGQLFTGIPLAGQLKIMRLESLPQITAIR